MIDDSERREVARRLREKSRKYARGLSSSHTSINAYHEVREVLYGTDGAPKSLCEFFDLLADLIDSSESGQNLDKNRDTVQIESPAVQIAPECDREALLALADEIEYGASSDDGEYHDLPATMVAAVARKQMEYARRIREACGEVFG